MLFQYHTLFHVNMLHAFYADTFVRDLYVEPTQDTARLMRQYGLIFRSNQGSFSVAYMYETGKAPVLAYLNELVPLRFILRNRNPYFLHITDLPFFNTQDQRLYLTNLGKSATEGAVPLSAAATVGEIDLLPTSSQLLLLPFSASDLGVIDLFVGKDANPLIAPPSTQPDVLRPTSQYALSFAARSTHWRYYIVPRNQQSFDRFEVFDGRTPLEFSEDPPHPLRGTDQVAITLSSKALFVLQERQSMKPRLKMSRQQEHLPGAPEQTATFELPTPDWKRLSPERSGESQHVYSDMYFFL